MDPDSKILFRYVLIFPPKKHEKSQLFYFN